MSARGRTATRSALVRAKVSLPVIRRASGVFEGQHSSLLTGQGHDFDDLVDYTYGDDAGVARLPARNGNAHLDFALDAAQERMESARGASAVSAMLEEILRVPQPRALLLLVTDDHWPGLSDGHTLRRIRTRHELTVLRVADMSVAAPGVDRMVDQATGTLIPAFLRDDPALRRDLEEERRSAHQFAAELLRANGVRHVTVSASEDVPGAIIELLRRHHA